MINVTREMRYVENDRIVVVYCMMGWDGTVSGFYFLTWNDRKGPVAVANDDAVSRQTLPGNESHAAASRTD
jgi:hypothetical protein